MRYRARAPDGDFQFGRANLYLIDTPEAVAAAVYTRLALQTGEWFLDLREGTPYAEQILGYGTQGTRDQALQQRILDTPGVRSILDYQSSLVDRRMVVACTIDTDYGTANLTITR
jgi:hypothetical protein